jgi:glycerol-3-phosphate cytidylyltransferase
VKTVITYGTYDLFHIGHLNILRRLREMGDRLVVGISTDEFNASKGKITVIPFGDRSQIVASIRYVDVVFPECSWDQKISDVQKYKADLFAMGDDWAGKFDFLKEHCEVLYLPRTDEVSSSLLKNVLLPLKGQKLTELKNALDTVAAIIGDLG